MKSRDYRRGKKVSADIVNEARVSTRKRWEELHLRGLIRGGGSSFSSLEQLYYFVMPVLRGKKERRFGIVVEPIGVNVFPL